MRKADTGVITMPPSDRLVEAIEIASDRRASNQRASAANPKFAQHWCRVRCELRVQKRHYISVLDRRRENAEAGKQQRAQNGADADNDTRIDALDQPAGDDTADGRADEVARGGAALERGRETALPHERIEQ